jgi:hypothetical protein
MIMLSVNRPCFLLIPNERNERILQRGIVVQLNGNDAVIQFEKPVGLKAGDETTLAAEVRGKFLQQGVNVVAMGAAAERPTTGSTAPPALPSPGCMISVTCVGEPVSAEKRGSFRVSVAAAAGDITARVGKQKDCHLADVSPEGCGIVCPESLTVGQTVNVAFTFQGITVEAPMRVQTARQLRNGRVRVGLFVPDKTSPARRALEKLSMLMQRLQLQRLAGAA